MIKRILSGLLALQMLVSILPVPSFAQDEAVLCETCAQEVCVCEGVQTCPTCGQENCESQHLTWCEVCRKDDCGVDHNTPAPLSDPAPIAEDNCPYCEDAVDADGNTTHEDTCNTRFSVDASSHVGKTAVFSMVYEPAGYTDEMPCEGMDYDALQEAEYAYDNPPLVEITDWHWDVSGPALWYRVAPLSGETLPDGISTESWILQNYTNEPDTFYNTLNFVNASMLNKTVAFSNATAFLYDSIERDYKEVVDITKLTEMVVEDIFYYEYEMYYVDSDNWPAEYADYHYVRADMVKEVEVVGPKCDVCGQPGCTRLHFYCERCNGYDCGKSHLVCPACDGNVVDCKLTHVWCGYCGDYDCGQEHEPMVPVTAPVIPENVELAEGQDVTLADEFGQAVTGEEGIVLIPGTKVSLSAWAHMVATDDVSYQWQICYDMEEDLWVSIQGHTEKGILVSQGMVQSLLEENEATALRCQVTVNGKTMTSTPIPVTMAEEPASFNLSSGASSSDASSQAEEDDLTKVHVVINYLFGNNTIAANPWIAELSAGSSISDKIKLPVVMGYLPTFDNTDNAALIQENNTYFLQINYSDGVAEDTTLNVVYQPTNVNVTVRHYQQNVDDDNRTLFETETKRLLTGSPVGEVHKTYEGFYHLLYEQPTVAADGSTVVDVYYDRYYYLMTFDLGGGYGVDAIYARYGAPIPKIEDDDPQRPGYIFDGWKLDGQTTTIASNMPARNCKYVAVWTPKKTTYDVVFWYENADNEKYAQAGVLNDEEVLSGTVVNGSDYRNTNFTGRDSTHFTYSHADENVTVKGDGSTVVNVYFSRNVYDLTFVMSSTANSCNVAIHASHTDACYTLACDKAHVHDDSCNRTLSCGKGDHAHTDSCLICTKTIHAAHDPDACYELDCNKTSHNHTTAGCTLKCTHEHSISCLWGLACSHSHADECYTCGQTAGIHTHSMANGCLKLTCNLEIHASHTEAAGCYKDTAHSHTDNCYSYGCGVLEHEHTDACKEQTCDHLHYHSGSTCYLVIQRKYDADLSDIWEQNPVKGVIDGGYVFKSSVTGDYYSFLEKMPGENITMTKDSFNGSYKYTWYYYLEVLPGANTTGLTTRTDNGRTYYLYHTSSAYASSLNLTYDEDYFPITGFTQRDTKVPAFSNRTAYLYYIRNKYNLTFSNYGNTVSGKGGSIYYQADISGQYFVPEYPETLEAGAYQFEGWYTSPFFGDTKFEFTTSNEDGIAVNATMPAEDITLYANWVPVSRTVRFFLDKDDMTEDITIPERMALLYAQAHNGAVDPNSPYVEFATKTDVPNKSFLSNVTTPGVSENYTNHPYNGYTFVGWFYMEDGVEKAFDPKNMPVNHNMDLYGKWNSDVLCPYEIYFVLDANGNGVQDPGETTQVADPITGSVLAGQSRTFDAKGDTALYADYQTGYFPNVKSHTIEPKAQDNDGDEKQDITVFTFLYKPGEPVPYTVRYLEKGTGTVLAEAVVYPNNMKAVVTENFKVISGYMPDAYQKTLVVTPTGENVIIFEYTQDTQHALYQINHYIQSVDGTAWTEYKSETITGDIGTRYSAAPVTINGFGFSAVETDKYNVTQGINGYTGAALPDAELTGEDSAKRVGAYADGVIAGTLTGNGMQLNLYYVRNEYPYQIYFLERGTDVVLKETVEGSDKYGKLFSYTATDVITQIVDPVTQKTIEFELYDTEPITKTMTIDVDAKNNEGVVEKNKLVFYYTRCTQDLTISKTVEGDVPDPNQSYNFTVTIDPKYSFHQSSYAIGGGKYLVPENGVLSFSLKAGESITIQDLPTAEYTIAEIVPDSADYIADIDSITSGDQSSVDIVLTKDALVTVTCVNKYPPKTGTLTINKTVTGAPAGETQSFIFHISGTADNGTKVDMDVTIIGSGSIMISDLPLGTYTVTEDTSWSWRYQCTNGASKEVAISSASLQGSVAFTNRYEENKWLNFSTVMNNLFACQAEGDDES